MRPSPARRWAPDFRKSCPDAENATAPGSGQSSFPASSIAGLVSNPIGERGPRPGEEDHRGPLQECSKVSKGLELHSPAGRARGEASVIEEALRVVPIGRPGQWPLFGDRPGLFEGAVALEVRPVTAHEGGHRLGSRQGEASRQPPEGPPEPGPDPGLPGGEPIEHQAPALVLVELQDAVDGVLRNDGVRVDEAEHPPGAGRDPALRAAAPVPPTQGTSRTPTSSAKTRTMAAVASSLPSSATMTSKEVSGSQRTFRETRRSSHTRENGFQDFANQRLLVSRRDHERETSLTHRVRRSSRRSANRRDLAEARLSAHRAKAGSRIHPATTREPPVALAAPTATGSAARRPLLPAEGPGRYRSGGAAW